MAKDRYGEEIEETKITKMIPSCVRCSRPMLGYSQLYGLCQTCIESEYQQNVQLLNDIQFGKVPRVHPKYAPAYTRKERDGRPGAPSGADREPAPDIYTIDEVPF